MAHTQPMIALTQTAPRSKDSLIGTRLNGFVITGTVSVGGMGVVYEARHPVIGRRAAVKVIRPDLCSDVNLSARFLREALAVSAVKHRNVVEIIDFGALPDGAQYMMMEFLEGDTLAQIIARDAPMQPLAALHIAEEILSGLSAAHQVGVVHRDLKPANIVLLKQSSGELIVKVLDFGLARQLDTAPEPTTRESLRELALEKSSLLAGTPEYISPEQASGEQVGAQGDLYCLGVILYEMLSGRLPFTSTSAWDLMQQHRLVTPPALSLVTPGVLPQLDELVMRLMKKDPAERPLGAIEAAREVARIQELLSRSGRLDDTMLFNREGQKGFGPTRAWKPGRAYVAAAAMAVGLLAVGLTFGADSAAQGKGPESPGLASPTIRIAPPPVVDPAPLAPAVVPAVAARPRARPVAASSCQPNETWKRASRDQLEDLEKLSLARMADGALPSEVAKIKQKARVIATSVKNAQGSECQQVEADLRAWRMALR